jgi:cardiolipin synthase
MKSVRSKATVAAVSVLATALVVLLVANLAMGDKQVDERIETLYRVADPQFRRTMGAMLGPPIVGGNGAQALVNGDRIFPAMLAAIRGAQRTITFETYIYWSGRVGRDFADALSERARAGVRVHVMLDAVGSGKVDDAFLEEMRSAGVEVRQYNPVRWYTIARLNNRTHRKLLVVDGKVGFTGGVGIADNWSGDAQDPEHWRDTHFRVEGPVVAQMQAAFMDNWVQVTGEVLHGEAYFPDLRHSGTMSAQVFTSSPGGGAESMQLMYLLSIAAAAKSIDLAASYFVPDDVEVRAFVAALQRGVKVRLILPGPLIDTEVVRRASRASWGELLRAGAEIHEYMPTMFHCKVMVVDGLWTSVGSTNFDNRSFSVNDEANLNVHDGDFAAEQVRVFEADLKRSRRITLQEWERRPWTEKAWEHGMGLLSSQL